MLLQCSMQCYFCVILCIAAWIWLSHVLTLLALLTYLSLALLKSPFCIYSLLHVYLSFSFCVDLLESHFVSWYNTMMQCCASWILYFVFSLVLYFNHWVTLNCAFVKIYNIEGKTRYNAHGAQQYSTVFD